MLSQWSMSEHEGMLRVASTTSPPWLADGSQQGESESYRHRARHRRRSAARGRAGRRPRPRRGHLRRPLHRRRRLRRHLPPDRPALRHRPRATRPRPRAVGELKIPGLLGLPAPGRAGPAARRRPRGSADGVAGRRAGVAVRRLRPRAPGAARPRGLRRAARAPRSSTTTTRSRGSPMHGLALLPIESYIRGGRGARRSSGCGSTPGGADPLGGCEAGDSAGRVRRTLELGGRDLRRRRAGIGGYDPSTMAPLARLDY